MNGLFIRNGFIFQFKPIVLACFLQMTDSLSNTPSNSIPSSTTNTNKQSLLFVSILSANLLDLGKECETLLQNGVDGFHIDLMDGQFVPNLSFGISTIAQLKRTFPFTLFDCHLMLKEPTIELVGRIIEAGATSISLHYESFPNANSLIQLINWIKLNQNIKCGIAINPTTEVKEIVQFVGIIDYVLVMTVVPGFGGQLLRQDCLDKVERLRMEFPFLNLQVDGGINEGNIEQVVCSGGNWIVSGTGITGITGSNQKTTIEKMKQIMK